MVNIIRPGHGASLNLKEDVSNLNITSTSLPDVFKRMVPENLFMAISRGDILSIIFFCILFGIFITRLNASQRETLNSLFSSGFQAMMKLTQFIMLLAPIGVWGILTKIVATTGFKTFKPLAVYALCVAIALAIHAILTLPLIIKFISKNNPLNLFKAQSPALITAFSTASSSAALPLTIKCIEERAGVSNKVSSFVLPLGATINMDGTALYECVAAMFIAQAYGVDLTFLQQVTVVITALLASIGAAGIPMAGLVMISIILSAVGLPLEGLGLILAIDRPLDMCRTAVNVWSDSCGAMTIASLEGEKDLLKVEDL
ncbi:MAG: dicarboxylate/amino acid:cation symporter [bacterium]